MLSTPKRRVLNFRITEDEYLHLRQATEMSGARSISEYARSVLLDAIGFERDNLNKLIIPFDARISHLETRVNGIIDVIARFEMLER